MADSQVNITLEADKEDMLLDEEEDTNSSGKGRLRSQVGKTDDAGRKVKGRGFGRENEDEVTDRYSGSQGRFEVIDDDSGTGPIRSIEGWIVFVTGVHEEATEDDILDAFSDVGEVRNLQLPLDRRTGFVKGYVLVEYGTKEEAEAAISKLNGTTFMEHVIKVDWAFSRGAGAGSKKPTGGRGEKRYSRK
jgi:RNA-binding protein 8A